MSQRFACPWLVLTLLLFACGREPTSVANDPYANGQSYPWEAYGPAQAQTLTPGTNTLQYESPTFARNSWGPVEHNRSNGEQQAGDGRPLTLNGRVHAQGYGVHAGSELRFSLKGTNGAQCFNFSADVGVDDEVGLKGSVVFQVFADGVKLYDSGVMTGASATKRLNVGVVGRQELRLVVTDAGNGISYDHADWADPKLECATQNPKPGSLDPSWGGLPGFPTAYGRIPNPNRALLGPDNTVLLGLGEIFAQQPDGKRLVVTNIAGGGKFEVRRTNRDGTPDLSFGSGGRVTIDFGSPSTTDSDEAYGARDAVLQPDGKLIVVGTGVGPSKTSDFALARYTTNGRLDPSFGQGGLVFTDFGPVRSRQYPEFHVTTDSAWQVKLGPGGVIVVEGTMEAYLPGTHVMARYNADGSLDRNFAGFGGIGMDVVITHASTVAFAVAASGDILLSGFSPNNADDGVETVVWRIPVSGGPEWSRSGHLWLPGQSSEGPESLAVQADGKIIVGAHLAHSLGNGEQGPDDGVLVRLNPDLTIDKSFGGDGSGQVLVTAGGRFGGPWRLGGFDRVLIQPDGKIVAVGRTILRFWP